MCPILQIAIRGSDKNNTFTYDYVFPPESGQEEVYNKAVAKVVHHLYKGMLIFIIHRVISLSGSFSHVTRQT